MSFENNTNKTAKYPYAHICHGDKLTNGYLPWKATVQYIITSNYCIKYVKSRKMKTNKKTTLCKFAKMMGITFLTYFCLKVTQVLHVSFTIQINQ